MNTPSLSADAGTCPYPGLRPFTKNEAEIFFGRDDQTDALLEKLNGVRFLTVVGCSGCGKSSLVRAGLMADLEGGLLSEVGAHWEMAEMRPGNDPFSALADALLIEGPVRSRLLDKLALPQEMQYAACLLRASLRVGPLGLVEVLKQSGLSGRTNFFLLVDQFEEIFAARKAGFVDETDAFVSLLLASAEQRELPLYVVITMRSDYLGNCALFSGLPEVINESQFLTPRLDRDQRSAAITGPASLFGGTIEEDLLNDLLNETGPSEDQLPVLQHLLMRMWSLALNDRKEADFKSSHLTLTRDHYVEAGGLKQAISKHAQEAYDELTEKQKHIAQRLFRMLCERGSDGREVRRLAAVESIAAVAGTTPQEVISVANVFRRRDRSFLTPPAHRVLKPETLLDISHEALIRNWDQLTDWVGAEGKSAENCLWLKQAARRWTERKGGLLQGLALRSALAWENQEKPTQQWAARYCEDYPLAMRFLRKSEQKRRRTSLKRTFAACGLVGLTAALLAWSGFLLVTTNEAQNTQIIAQRELLQAQAIEAEIGTNAQRQSNEFFRNAQNILKRVDNPQAKALALAALSRAVQRDQHNTQAIELTCDLLLKNRWCPPLTPPLHHSSDSPILCATLVPEGTGNRILAISQDGWILECRHGDTSFVRTQNLAGDKAPRVAFVSAFFSNDGRELLTIPQSSGSGPVKAQFWKLDNDSYQTRGTVDITDAGPINCAYWSSNGKLLVFVPTRWDRNPVCQAFRFDGASYVEIPQPFGEFHAVAVTMNSSDGLIAAASPTGDLQLWKWDGSAFAKLDVTSKLNSSFSLTTQSRPNSLAFNPDTDELIVSSFDRSGQVQVELLNIRTNKSRSLEPPTSKDRFMRFVLGPIDGTNRLIATALYGRVVLNDVQNFDPREPIAEPIGFQGTTGRPVFSRDGRELLTLSGAVWLAMDTVQTWDLRFKPALEEKEKFQSNGQPAPDWLADLARAISGVPRTFYDEENSSPTLQSVRAQARPDTIRSPYLKVWRHFFSSTPQITER